MTDAGARMESAYLLPAALSKAQFGAWWTAALDEGLMNRGECVWPVELWLDPAQLRREPQPFNAWRPRGELTRFPIPPEDGAQPDWKMTPGSILGFREIDGLILQLDTKLNDEELRFLAFDARCFDEQLEWKSLATRDRLLHLVSRALVSRTPDADTAIDAPLPIASRVVDFQAVFSLQQRLRAKA